MKHTIKFKIQVAIAIIIASVSAVQAWISISQLKTETTKQVYGQMTDIGKSTSNFIASWLDTRTDMMLANESIISTNRDVDRELLVTKRAGNFLSVYAGFTDGRIAFGDKTEDWPADYDPRTRPWYRDAINAGKTIITEPYQDFDGSIVVSIAKSFQGQYSGVLASDLTINNIIKEVLSLDIDNAGYAFLVDGENRIVAYRDEALSQKPLTQLDNELTADVIRQLASGQQVGTFFQESDGSNKLIFTTPIAGTTWTLGVVQDEELAFASISQQMKFVLIASVVLYLVIAAIATYIITNLLRPLTELSKSVEQLAQGSGDLTQRIEIKRMDEIGELAENMNSFLGQLQMMIKGIVSQSMNLSQYAEQSAEQAEQASLKVSDQQNDVNQIATAIHEMSATSAEVASHAEMTASAAQASTEACESGKHVISQNREAITSLANQVQDAANVIHELESNAQNINQILSTIQASLNKLTFLP